MRIVERTLENLNEVVHAERLEAEHLAPREQRRVHREAGVLGRRPDQHDRAVLDVGQERILPELC